MTAEERDWLRSEIDKARRARIQRSRTAKPRRRGYWDDCEQFVKQIRADRRKQAA